MTQLKPRSSLIDLLIQDYGNYIGIADLAFDEDNLLSFDMDGTAVTLHYKGDIVGILLKAVMPLSAKEISPGFLAILHGVNFSSIGVGMGSVVLDREFGAWVWIDRIDPRAMTASILHERINRAARDIAFWSAQISEMIRKTPAEMPAADHDPFNTQMIRV